MTFRIERGVRRDEVPLVENIRGLDRHCVRKLREYLNRPDIAGVDQMPDGSLWEQLTAFYVGLDNPDFFVETLSGNVSGVGNGPPTGSKNSSVTDRLMMSIWRPMTKVLVR